MLVSRPYSSLFTGWLSAVAMVPLLCLTGCDFLDDLALALPAENGSVTALPEVDLNDEDEVQASGHPSLDHW
ncbi:MAG TPA: hypothetical protein DIU15_14165, partial [Deltaproteobacteria bacterium]|nr:hypothetical protein [Deltaproteobacteria bacterium]